MKAYIYKWLLIPKWYTVERWSTGEKFKTSKLTPGQIEGLLHLQVSLRKRNWYRLADSIRDRLTAIGYNYLSPMDCKEINKDNTLGHIRKGLIVKQTKDKTILKGYIHTEKHSSNSFQFEYCVSNIGL